MHIRPKMALGTNRDTVDLEHAKKRRLPPEKRRRQLLDIAVTVFSKQGIGAARHAGIADQAGVAVSTVFVYFPTRQDLVEAVLGEVDDLIVRVLSAAIIENDSDPDVVRRLVQAFVGTIESHPAHVKVLLEWSISFHDDIWPRFLDLQSRLIDLFASALLDGQPKATGQEISNAQDAARILIGSAFVLSIMKFSGEPDQRVERFGNGLSAALTVQGLLDPQAS